MKSNFFLVVSHFRNLTFSSSHKKRTIAPQTHANTADHVPRKREDIHAHVK